METGNGPHLHFKEKYGSIRPVMASVPALYPLMSIIHLNHFITHWFWLPLRACSEKLLYPYLGLPSLLSDFNNDPIQPRSIYSQKHSGSPQLPLLFWPLHGIVFPNKDLTTDCTFTDSKKIYINIENPILKGSWINKLLSYLWYHTIFLDIPMTANNRLQVLEG